MPRDFGRLPDSPLPEWARFVDRVKRRVNYEIWRRFSQRHALASYYPFFKLTRLPELFNWGEPLLHPRILDVINLRGQGHACAWPMPPEPVRCCRL